MYICALGISGHLCHIFNFSLRVCIEPTRVTAVHVLKSLAPFSLECCSLLVMLFDIVKFQSCVLQAKEAAVYGSYC